MTRKTTKCYEAVFRYIKEHIFDCEGESFMTDYESAMRQGLKNVFPNNKLHACWFHYCQAVKRKCESYPDLKHYVVKDKLVSRLYHKFLALPLLPAESISEGFEIIVEEVNCLCQPMQAAFRGFITYFKKQWLTRVSIFILTF